MKDDVEINLSVYIAPAFTSLERWNVKMQATAFEALEACALLEVVLVARKRSEG